MKTLRLEILYIEYYLLKNKAKVFVLQEGDKIKGYMIEENNQDSLIKGYYFEEESKIIFVQFGREGRAPKLFIYPDGKKGKWTWYNSLQGGFFPNGRAQGASEIVSIREINSSDIGKIYKLQEKKVGEAEIFLVNYVIRNYERFLEKAEELKSRKGV